MSAAIPEGMSVSGLGFGFSPNRSLGSSESEALPPTPEAACSSGLSERRLLRLLSGTRRSVRGNAPLENYFNKLVRLERSGIECAISFCEFVDLALLNVGRREIKGTERFW